MSAFLDTSSAIIGDYMLRGWTLTDRTCNHCHLTPLMRQPLREVETEAQREEFCATCQGGPGRAVRPPQSTQTDSNANGPVSNVNAAHNGVNGANGHSRSVSDSTSFGDLSSSKSEPEMDMSFEIPAHIATVTPAVENPSFTERDAQSARASSLIGDMLLRGFSLLADSCPNSTCYGIPLVGQPRSRRPGGRDVGFGDTKKQCVICNRVYDKDGNLLQGGSIPRAEVQPAAVNGIREGQGTSTVTVAHAPQDSPRSLARRALYDDGEKTNLALKTAVDPSVANKTSLEPAAAYSQQSSRPLPSSGHKSHEVVSESIEALVFTLEKLNSELRRMMEQPDITRTIKDKGMKRCLTRMRDTTEALALAEEIRAKLEQ